MSKIGKNDLVGLVAEKTSMTKKQVNEVVDAIEMIVSEKVKAGSEVSIGNLCKFKPVERKARGGINPKTKEKISIPASKSVSVKACKELRKF